MLKRWMRRWLVQRMGKYAQQRLQSAASLPRIVAITGSVGKSSLREAIVTALSPSMRVLSTKKNYNTEIGVPLVLLGLQAAESSWMGWLSVLRQARTIARQPWLNAPDVIVLEFGIDRPGDMDTLRSLVTPDIAVIGPIPDPPVHGEFFPSSVALAQEKGKIAAQLANDAVVIVADGYPLSRVAVESSGHAAVVSYGGASADVAVTTRKIVRQGMQFAVRGTIEMEGRSHVVSLPGHVALHTLDAVAAAFAVTKALHGSVDAAVQAVSSLKMVPRRLEHKRAGSGVHVLDDTYNASPGAMREAVEMLAQLPISGRKIAVLGTMRELDPAVAQQAHLDIAAKAAQLGCELVVLGEHAPAMARVADGMAVASAEEALRYVLAQPLTQDDAILFKASNALGLSAAVDTFLQRASAAR